MEVHKNFVEKKLDVVYEDKDVIVRLAPDYDKLEEIVLELIKSNSNGMTIKEVHDALRGVASEEKIRRVIYKYRKIGIIAPAKDGKYIYSNKLRQ